MYARLRHAALCLALLAPGCGTPAPGAGWTHQELLAHLEAKGLKFEVTDRSDGPGEPSVWVRFAGVPAGRADEMRMANSRPRFDAQITLVKSERDAKDRAGALGDGGFSWGRFLVQGYKPDSLALVRKAIDGTLRDADVARLRRERQAEAEADR